MRPLRSVLWLLPVFAFGCGGGGPVAVHPVHGQVIYAGKPAANVQVFLYPTSAPTVPTIPTNPHGLTGADGKFTLTTYTPEDGAPAGAYQVLLFWRPEQKETGEEADVDRLFGWYDVAHSKLTAQIKPGDNALPPFRLAAVSAPPAKLEGIPGRN